MKHGKLTTEEFILLMLAAGGALAVLPFAVLRFLNNDWLLFALDSILILCLGLLAVFVFRTHRIRGASFAVSILGLGTALASAYIKGPAQVYWLFPALLIAFYLLQPREAFIISAIVMAIVMSWLYDNLPIMNATTLLITLILTVAFSYAFAATTASQRKQLMLSATQDPLTGAGNRRALADKLTSVLAMQQRKPTPMSLLLVDLDHFKSINDEFGHAVGDDVLVRVVNVIDQRTRVTDSVFRVGGEEFLVVAESTDTHVATTLADDLRSLVESKRWLARSVTISVGIAEYEFGESADQWLGRADDALYAAKRSGRNKTINARGLSDEDVVRMDSKANS